MTNKFLTRLIELVDNFRLEGAEKLSLEMNKAESEGYELSKREDIYWLELTVLIQESYKNKNSV